MIEVVGKRILVSIIKEEKTQSGIIINNNEEKIKIGQIVSIGENKDNFKIGQKVLFDKYCGDQINYEGETYLVLKQEDVLAIIR